MSGLLAHRGVMMSVAAAPVSGTWNPADISPLLVLSNGNKSVAKAAITSTFGSVRGTVARNSGKLYFEVATSASFNAGSSAAFWAGVADTTAAMTDRPVFGSIGGHYAAKRGNGQYGNQGGFVGNSDSFAGDGVRTMGIAVDFVTRTVTFYMDGAGAVSTSYSAGGGDMFPLGSVEDGAAATGMTLDLKLTASEFLQSIPATYSEWGT